MRFRNLTPHAVVVYDADGHAPVRVFEPEGTVLRLVERIEPAGEIDGVPVVKTAYSQLEGEITDCRPGDVLIVSSVVLPNLAGAVPAGVRVVAPDTGPQSVVRRDDGRILGVRRFRVMDGED